MHYRSLDGDGGRAGTPGGDILVKRADQQVGDGAHRLARAEYVSEETAILIAGVTYKIPQISEGVFTKTVLGQVRAEKLFSRRAIRAGRNWIGVKLLEIVRGKLCNLLH